MKVGLDTNDVFRSHSGARTYLVELLPELARLAGDGRFVAAICDQDASDPESLVRLTRYPNFKIVEAPFPGRDLWRRMGTPSVEGLRDDLNDLDVCHSVEAPRIPSKAPRKLITLQDFSSDAASSMPRWQKKNIASSDGIIVPSHKAQSDVLESLEVDEDRVHVIHTGVNERYLQPPKPAQLELLFERHAFLQEPYLLALGTGATSPHGVRFLIEACARARTQDPGIPPLCILARPGQVPSLFQQLEREPSTEEVLLIEELDRDLLPGLYRGAELVLDPGQGSSFGQSVLEAGACSVPAITDPGRAVLEILADGAHTAPPEEAAWAEAIAALHKDPERRDALGRSAQESAILLTWQRAAEQHWALYES